LEEEKLSLEPSKARRGRPKKKEYKGRVAAHKAKNEDNSYEVNTDCYIFREIELIKANDEVELRPFSRDLEE